MSEGPWSRCYPPVSSPSTPPGTPIPPGSLLQGNKNTTSLIMDIQAIRRKNLSLVLAHRFGGVRARMAEAIDVSPSTLSRIRAGKPVMDVIRRWEAILQYEPGALDKEDFDPSILKLKPKSSTAPGLDNTSADDSDENLFEITPVDSLEIQDPKKYQLIKALPPDLVALGAGARYCLAEDCNIDYTYRAYSIDFFIKHKLDPRNLLAFKVYGDSMMPMLQDGCWVLVDTSKTKIIDKNVYALVIDNSLMVKQLVNGVLGELVVNSLSPEYPTVVIDLKSTHVKILGRVVEYSCVL